MTVTEICNRINSEGCLTEDTVDILIDSMLHSDIDSYQHEDFKMFISTINRYPANNRIQELIYKIVENLSENGVESPCGSGCDDSCALHSMEF